MSNRIKALKQEWVLVSDVACNYQVEGQGVECWCSESDAEPQSLDGARTVRGDKPYRFDPVGTTKLWAYPKRNGAIIIVDPRSGVLAGELTRFSQLTAFGEFKVAEYDLIAAWLFPYNINTELIIQTTDNGGTVTQSGSFAVLETSTAADGRAKIETRKALRYQTGIGGIARFTAIFSDGVDDSSQIIGLGDDDDGFFFGFQGAEFGIIRRNDGVDNFTAQADWTGSTRADFDPSTLNVYQIQFQWLGGGEVRFFIEDRDVGGFVLVHVIKFAGTATDVTVQNPSLPLMAEVVNSGNVTSLVLRTPSASAGLEGNSDNSALKVTRSAYGSNTNVGTSFEPIVTIRNPATYQGATNRLTLRGLLWTPASAGNGSDISQCALFRNATLTGASYTSIDAGATPAEEDTSATAISGGTLLASVVLGTVDSKAVNIKDLDISIRPGETLTVAARAAGGPRIESGFTFESEV